MRSLEKELMDEGIHSQEQWLLFIKDLSWINRYLIKTSLFTHDILMFYKNTLRPITVAEFACGGGTLLKNIALWAKKYSFNMQFSGYDINPVFIDYANKQISNNLKFETQDIFDLDFLTNKFDIIICNLFCHHLDDAQLVKFFQQAQAQANLGVIINDLHRHNLAQIGFSMISFIKQFSPMVRHDGLVSIRRGFVKQELVTLLQRAGIENYKIKWCFPFHYKINIFK